MKCCFCNSEDDILRVEGKCIFLHCAEKKRLTVCAKNEKDISNCI